MEYYGKKILTQEEFDFEAGHIGDYVEQAVINDAMDILPPVYMAADCLQVGEPCCYAKDPNTGMEEWTLGILWELFLRRKGCPIYGTPVTFE